MPKKNAKGGKGGKGGKDEAQAETSDDPSVLRLPTKQAPAPTNVPVLPSSVSVPVPLYPVWNETEVIATYTPPSDEDAADPDPDAAAATPLPFTGTFVDHTLDLTNFLPPSMANQTHKWLRPIEAVDLPFWVFAEGEEKRTSLPEFEMCVVDLEVPPTEEEVAQVAAAEEAHQAACVAAEEAGEETPSPPAPPPSKPIPREMLRPLSSNDGYASRFASVFEVINSVAQSYAAKKMADAPPPPTAEEAAAAAEEARIKAEEEAEAVAAAAKGKKGKKGKDAAEEVVEETAPSAFPEDPDHPLPPGQFLWECIYPKGPDGSTPKYNSEGRYVMKRKRRRNRILFFCMLFCMAHLFSFSLSLSLSFFPFLPLSLSSSLFNFPAGTRLKCTSMEDGEELMWTIVYQ